MKRAALVVCVICLAVAGCKGNKSLTQENFDKINAGMSLADVADRAGLFREAVARAERPGIDPRASTVAALARALGVPVCELYDESGHERRRRKPIR